MEKYAPPPFFFGGGRGGGGFQKLNPRFTKGGGSFNYGGCTFNFALISTFQIARPNLQILYLPAQFIKYAGTYS